MKDKKHFRSCARSIKWQLDFSWLSQTICNKLVNNTVINNSSCVMLYMAMSDEIDLTALYDYLKTKGKTCCFPVVDGDNMYAVTADDGFKKGSFGILEPCGKVIASDLIDLVVVPGVMFDINCQRLGRGKGYYDRFLSEVSAFKIGVCPDVLIVEMLPCDAHDLPMNIIVTEKRVITGE